MHFDGDFTFIPFRAELDLGSVPCHPTSANFADAVTALRAAEDASPDGIVTVRIAAARWRVEAVRARLAAPGCALDTRKLASSAAAELVAWARA